MGVRLTVKMKGEAGGADKAKTVMLDNEVITLGRDPACEVQLAQQAVSRNHARISRDGTLFFVEDLGSSFGTELNGTKLPKGEKRLLRNGDTIAIAQFDVTFDRIADVGAENSDAKTSFLSRKVVKDVMKGLSAGGENAYFRVMNGTQEGQRIEVSDASEIVFGRDADAADVVLNDDLVSRRHVKVRRDWSGTHVEDLGSRNGIKVARKRTKKATLKDRDEVEIGGVRLLFIDPSEVHEDPVVLPNANGPSHSDTNDDEDEGTISVKPAPEPQPAPVAASEAPDSSEPTSEPNGAASSEDESEALQESEEESVAERPVAAAKEKLIDFSNKNTLIMLAVVGTMVLIAVVLLILLIAGA
jgi:pSer/pThr/pTyr-binding forkhead associated (FHA) protein